MNTETILNGATYVTLEHVLAGETQAPPIYPEFSVLLVGALKLDVNEDDAYVRLYPTDGREDNYYRIRKTDIDTDRIEPLSPEARAARGMIADRVFRIRVRPTAEVVSVHLRTVEARKLSDEEVAAAICRPGRPCGSGYSCESDGPGRRVCTNGVNRIPCNDCVP